MGPNPKGLTLLPEPPTSTGAPPLFVPHFKSFPKPPISHPIHFLQSRCNANPYCGSAWQRASSKTSTCCGCARATSKKKSLKKIIRDSRRHGEFYVVYSSGVLHCQKPVSIKLKSNNKKPDYYHLTYCDITKTVACQSTPRLLSLPP